MTVMSKTINDYMLAYSEDRTTKFVNMACPVSLRPPPRHLGDFTFDNDFAIVNMKLRLVDNLESGIKLINKDMSAIKQSMEPIGLLYLIKVLMMMPQFLS